VVPEEEFGHKYRKNIKAINTNNSAWKASEGFERPGLNDDSQDAFLDGQEGKAKDDLMIQTGMAISSLHPDNPFHPGA